MKWIYNFDSNLDVGSIKWTVNSRKSQSQSQRRVSELVTKGQLRLFVFLWKYFILKRKRIKASREIRIILPEKLFFNLVQLFLIKIFKVWSQTNSFSTGKHFSRVLDGQNEILCLFALGSIILFRYMNSGLKSPLKKNKV